MIKNKFFILLVIVFFIVFLNKISANEQISYNLNTEIIILDNGVLEFKNTFSIDSQDIIDNNYNIYFNFFNINNEFINIKINSIEFTDFFIEEGVLYLNLENINKTELFNFEINYFTDSFTYKNKNDWYIEYIPLFSTKADTLLICVSENYIVNNVPLSLSSTYLESNNLYFLFNNISYLKFNYNVKNNIYNKKDNNAFLFLFLIVFLIILVSIYLIFYKIKLNKSNNKIKNKDILKSEDKFKDLLLGLNENEQKIIKLLLLKDGISQKNIALKTFLPKGTVSRNIKKLESKDYIVIKPYGVTHKIFLSQIFKK
jgi:uncharacterized membrane protein